MPSSLSTAAAAAAADSGLDDNPFEEHEEHEEVMAVTEAEERKRWRQVEDSNLVIDADAGGCYSGTGAERKRSDKRTRMERYNTHYDEFLRRKIISTSIATLPCIKHCSTFKYL